MSGLQQLNIWLGNWLAERCKRVAERLTESARRLRRCEQCGRSRFYGEACVGAVIDKTS